MSDATALLVIGAPILIMGLIFGSALWVKYVDDRRLAQRRQARLREIHEHNERMYALVMSEQAQASAQRRAAPAPATRTPLTHNENNRRRIFRLY
ncbi:MAG: hypothetical protein EBT15_09450 [Betaproteobacteria bacterium]|nr:hypothetical protein [Betaproteobacteria bacterium]